MGDEKLQFDFTGATAPSPVPLAHVPPFAVGPLTVEPALRRARAADGRSDLLEPLVLQVLITLASARQVTLSRDDLIAACWDGRIVSDDAINRVISKLRRVLAGLSGEAVRLETVPKVGYRLVANHAPQAPVPDRPALSPRRPRRLFAAGALTLAGLVLGGGAWAYFARGAAPGDVTVAVEPVTSTGNDREAQAFASALTGDLSQLAGAISRVSFVDDGAQAPGKENFVVRVAVDREAERLVARVRLVDGGDGSVLWSDRFGDTARSPDGLRRQVAMATAGVMRCGLEPSAAVLGDATSTRLFFAACNAVMQNDPARGESFARQIVARRPEVGAGWGCLAMTTLYAGMGGTPDQAAAARAKARRYALHALELDPNVGRAYQALALAAPQGSVEQMAILAKGIAADPEQPALYRVQSYALADAGYTRASLVAAQRALALDPTSSAQFVNVERRLEALGRIDEARAMQARAEQQWPGDPAVLREGAYLLRYAPEPAKALIELDRVASQLPPQAGVSPLLRAELQWRAGKHDVAVVERIAQQAFARNPVDAWTSAAMFARLGETERALAWIARAPGGGDSYQWSFLFWPEAAAVRRDPRFFAAMAKLGLVQVWQARREWPDFCSEPGLRYDCRAEAVKLTAPRA